MYMYSTPVLKTIGLDINLYNMYNVIMLKGQAVAC